MVHSRIKVAARGEIRVYKVVDNERVNILTRNNTILPSALPLVASIVGGNAAAAITKIDVFDGASLQASAPFTSVVVDTLLSQTTFTALFNEASFTGDVTAARLGPTDSGTLGFFAEATGLTLTKSALEQMIIEWVIFFA